MGRAFALAAVCLMFLVPRAWADEEEEKSAVRRIVDGLGSTIYAAAWPTATYSKMSFKGIERVKEGYAVKVQISGTSSFDNSELWLRIALLIRDGKLVDWRVVGHNAVIAEPFSTIKNMAALISQISQQPANGAVIGADAACLLNPTDATIAFSIQWEGGPWVPAKLAPGEDITFYWQYPPGTRGSPTLHVNFDASYAEGSQDKLYRLEKYSAAMPLTCNNARIYQFVPVVGGVDLRTFE